MNVKEITKTTLNLVVFCAIVGFLLSFYNGLTSGPIAENKRKEVVEVQKKLLEADEYKAMDAQGMPDAWKAVKGGKLIGYIVKSQASGYSSSEKITLMYSVSPDFKITGVNIVSQNETPGLGTNIEEDKKLKQFGDMPFVAQFNGKTLNALKIGSSSSPGADYIAAITGATVSSKAVTVGIHDSLKKLEEAAKGGGKSGGAPADTASGGKDKAPITKSSIAVPEIVKKNLKAHSYVVSIPGRIWKGLDSAGKLMGFASLGKNRGFRGPLDVIVFNGPDLKIRSVELYRHSEDPVYLKKIADAGFYKQFIGKKSLMDITFKEPGKKKGDSVSGATAEHGNRLNYIPDSKSGIDTVTGATVTCRAITGAVLDAQDRLLLNNGK